MVINDPVMPDSIVEKLCWKQCLESGTLESRLIACGVSVDEQRYERKCCVSCEKGESTTEKAPQRYTIKYTQYTYVGSKVYT